MGNEELMTTKQVADYLQLHIITVYQWSREGKLPTLRLGKTIRFRKSEIDAWIDSHNK